jgi:hypothetical protein
MSLLLTLFFTSALWANFEKNTIMKQKNFLLFLFLPFWVHSQIQFSMTKLIGKDTISMYTIVDDVEFRYVQVPQKDGQVFANGVSIDTMGISMSAIQYARLLVYHDKVYFNTLYQYDSIKYPKNKKIAYSMTDGKVTTFDYEFSYDLYMNPYKIDRQYARIYRFNPETGEQTLFADFWNNVVKSMYYSNGEKGSDEDIDQILFTKNNHAYVSLCYNDGSSGDGCTEVRYFMVNNTNNKIDITRKIRPQYNSEIGERLSNYTSEMQFISNDGKYIKDNCYVDIYNVETKKGVLRGYISRLFDIQFNYISDLLYLLPKISGINIQKGVIQNYFLDSNVEAKDSTKRIGGEYAKKYVMIPYVFNPTLELAMYKAYNNNLLIKEDIKELGKYELGILRNVIFAKYNYAFTSEFYQAYFNLYEFYNDRNKQQSRLKDVSHLLTEIDKTNIKFIKDVEENL